MKSLREILARIAEINAEAKEIRAAGDLTPERQTRVEALLTELDVLETEKRQRTALDDLERRSAGRPLANGGDRYESAAARVTMLDVIQAGMGLNSEGAGRAREVSQEIATRSGRNPEGLYFPTDARPSQAERRALSLSTGDGAALVGLEVSPNVIDMLRAKLILTKLGATFLSGLQANFAIPRIDAGNTAQWVPDGTALTPGNPALDQVSFVPHHLGGITPFSRSLLLQSSPDVARLVESDLASSVANAIDAAAINGTGTGGQPTGILNTAGLNVVSGGTNGAAPSYANLTALIGNVDVSNALDGKLGWAISPKAGKALRSTLKSTADTSSNYILSDPNVMAGYPYVSSNTVPSNLTKGTGTALSAIIFGDWSSVIVGQWSALDVLVNPYGASYAAGGVDCRVMASIDIGIRHIAAFSALTDVIAS